MTKIIFVIIGGGAAGIFAALRCARLAPNAKVIVLEKTAQLLAKVRISGGGRCNVTHAAFDPKTLIGNYPRGHKELLGPFYQFQPRDTIQWFLDRGVKLKTESDGRIFPVSDSSETIINCLLKEARACQVDIRTEQKIQGVAKTTDGYEILFANQPPLQCDALVLATGSAPQGLALAESLGHTLISPVPSLFTFNVPSSPLLDLSGISCEDVALSLPNLRSTRTQRGPLLLTHFGFSGPAVLKLSAWEARALFETSYRTELQIHWLPSETKETLYAQCLALKKNKPLKHIENENPFSLPSNLWKRFVSLAKIPEHTPISHIPNQSLQQLSLLLTRSSFQIEGKTTHKQEFVTCGGVNLKEIDFKTMQGVHKGLFFAGECLNIDGITGGFNFQNAWTTGWIAGTAMANLQRKQ